MAKVRVYELAKEQGISSKDLLEILKDLGVDAKSHVSSIEDSIAKLVLDVIGSQKDAGVIKPAQSTIVEDFEVKKVPAEKKASSKPQEIKDKKATAIVEESPSKAPVAVIPKIPEKPQIDTAVMAPKALEEPEEIKMLQLSLPVTVAELAQKMSIPAKEIIKKMLENDMVITINHSLDQKGVEKIFDNFGFLLEIIEKKPLELEEEKDDPRMMVSRPPVVTILGHVDHGKTSLLDAIRKTNETAKEAGGITQKIGAYTVEHSGRRIVFIDTPGHEAFTAMRARGAQITDIAILVVAADDGVMPQTIEAINHAKAAKVPIIVAMNKIDKPQANPDRIKQQLADLGLLSEDWGGDTICIPVSAREKTGLNDLLEMILLVADMNEFKANPKRRAFGIIIEANLDKGLGPVATVIVKKGTLRLGDSVIAGMACGKVRVLINDKGERIKKVTPSIPAEIVGLSEVARAGDILQVVDDEKIARQITGERQVKERHERLVPGPKTTLDEIFRNMEQGEKKELNIIIKAEGQGSVEAIKHSLMRLSDEDVNVNVIHSGVGAVTESDILLAHASKAIIIGFDIKLDPNIKKLSESEKVDIRLYNVIYHVIDDIKAAMKGMLDPEFEEVMIGKVEVREVFKISKIGVIAGCFVSSGKVTRNADVRVVRDNAVIHQGKIDSLKRFKDDVKEVLEGFECGIGVEKFTGIQQSDVIEVYKLQEKPR